MPIVDLSHRIRDGMRSYPGIPAPRIDAFLTHEASRARYDGQCELTFSHVDIIAGVGTYLDSPYHRDPSLPDHAALALDTLVDLEAVCLDLTTVQGRVITPQALGDPAEWRGRALLLRTGMDAHWDTDRYWNGGPHMTEASAALIVRSGALLVGADFLNVDDTGDPRRPVHTALLRAGIPIIENLRSLDRLPRTGARLHAATLPLEGAASFPIRAYAVVPA